MEVGFGLDPIYLKHDTGQHPENAKRLEVIISHLERTGLKQQLTSIKPRAASVKATLDMLLGDTVIEDPLGQSPRKFGVPSITPLIKAIKGIHNLV